LHDASQQAPGVRGLRSYPASCQRLQGSPALHRAGRRERWRSWATCTSVH